MQYHPLSSTLAVLLMLAVSGCDEDQAPVPERIRAIKTFTVSEAAGGNIRKFAGTIVASDKSSLSFSAGGTVLTVDVKQGDRVKAGQVLATLDPKPFELDVDAATSQVNSARAKHEEKALELGRQQTLYEKNIVAKAALDKAAAAAATTSSDVDVARARLAQLERDLERTKLRSPYDGVIGARTIEPFTDVSAGQGLFEINSEGSFELEFSVPDKDVGRIALRQSITAFVDSVAECGCKARITEIGTISTAANAVTIRATIAQAPPELLPGSSAEATILFAGHGTTRGYLIPIVAVAAASDGTPEKAFVFRYSADTGTVARVPITAGEGRDNLIEVTEGVQIGDIIAAAGVSFLRDGQKVKLLAN